MLQGWKAVSESSGSVVWGWVTAGGMAAGPWFGVGGGGVGAWALSQVLIRRQHGAMAGTGCSWPWWQCDQQALQVGDTPPPGVLPLPWCRQHSKYSFPIS